MSSGGPAGLPGELYLQNLNLSHRRHNSVCLQIEGKYKSLSLLLLLSVLFFLSLNFRISGKRSEGKDTVQISSPLCDDKRLGLAAN